MKRELTLDHIREKFNTSLDFLFKLENKSKSQILDEKYKELSEFILRSKQLDKNSEEYIKIERRITNWLKSLRDLHLNIEPSLF